MYGNPEEFLTRNPAEAASANRFLLHRCVKMAAHIELQHTACLRKFGRSSGTLFAKFGFTYVSIRIPAWSREFSSPDQSQ